MQLTHLLVILSIMLAPSQGQKLTPNAVTSLLQGILSPKNTEQVMQMLSTAAHKKRALSNVPGTNNRRVAVTDVPNTVLITEAPNGMTHLVQIPSEKCMKKNVMVQNPNNVIIQNGNQMILPKNMVVQRRPGTVLPKNVVIQNGGEATLPRNVVVRKNEMPRRVVVQNDNFAVRLPQMRVSEVVQQNVLIPQPKVAEYVPMRQEKVLISQPKVTEYVTASQQRGPVRNENPFLPAASPISPLTALSSSGIPTATPQSRGQYLRKIPIPPPTI